MKEDSLEQKKLSSIITLNYPKQRKPYTSEFQSLKFTQKHNDKSLTEKLKCSSCVNSE